MQVQGNLEKSSNVALAVKALQVLVFLSFPFSSFFSQLMCAEKSMVNSHPHPHPGMQERMPKACVVYCSATGVSSVTDAECTLVFMHRPHVQ